MKTKKKNGKRRTRKKKTRKKRGGQEIKVGQEWEIKNNLHLAQAFGNDQAFRFIKIRAKVETPLGGPGILWKVSPSATRNFSPNSRDMYEFTISWIYKLIDTEIDTEPPATDDEEEEVVGHLKKGGRRKKKTRKKRGGNLNDIKVGSIIRSLYNADHTHTLGRGSEARQKWRVVEIEKKPMDLNGIAFVRLRPVNDKGTATGPKTDIIAFWRLQEMFDIVPETKFDIQSRTASGGRKKNTRKKRGGGGCASKPEPNDEDLKKILDDIIKNWEKQEQKLQTIIKESTCPNGTIDLQKMRENMKKYQSGGRRRKKRGGSWESARKKEKKKYCKKYYKGKYGINKKGCKKDPICKYVDMGSGGEWCYTLLKKNIEKKTKKKALRRRRRKHTRR
jgi:hypothetical protein